MKLARLPFAVAAFTLTVAACSGGGGSSSASNVPGSPNTPETKASSVSEALVRLDAANTATSLDHGDTVAGTDANTNGVRDDVERYIDAKPDTAEQKASLRQMSKALGTAMATTPTDAAGLRTATDQLNNAVACLWKRYTADTADSMVQEMRKATVNTRQRYDAYMAYNGAVAGTVIKLPREVNCD